MKIKSYLKTLEKRLFLQFLLDFDKPGVFALVNEKKKKIYIQSNRHPLTAIASLVKDLNGRYHGNIELRKDVKGLSIKILETFESGGSLKIAKLKWFEYYKRQGYAFYNTQKLPVYRWVKRLVEDSPEVFKLQVGIGTAGKRFYPVREFGSYSEAEAFINSNNILDVIGLGLL